MKRSHSRSSTESPVRSALAPATSSAPGDASTPVTSAPRMLVRDRERDRAASRPHVEDVRLGDAGDPHEAALDHDLRLGSRDEHATIDAERQPPESPLAEHVREWLPAFAAGGELFERPSPLRDTACATASSASSDRGSPRTCATRISASTRGESQPTVASRSEVSASARATFTRRRPRGPGAAPRPEALP